MARHAAVLLLCAALLASAPAPTKAGLWDSIKDVFHDTWDKTTGVFSSVGTCVRRCNSNNRRHRPPHCTVSSLLLFPALPPAAADT